MMRRRQDRGIALVVVLWVSLLVAAIAGAFIVDTRTSARLTRNFIDNAEARALADGGVHLAIYELLQPEEAARPARDGRVFRRVVPGGVLDIAIEDEAGKIDLNFAGSALLQGLFVSAGVDPSAAQGLVTMIESIRTGDSTAGRSLRALGAPNAQITPADQHFIAVDALGQLPGISASLFARLQPALTVYGLDDGLNYLYAPREALLAVPDVTPEAVDLFVSERSAADTPAPLQQFLSQGQARNHWREDNSAFVTVKVVARADNGAAFARLALVEIGGRRDRPFAVREWREGDATMLESRDDDAQPAAAGGRGGSI